MKKILPFVAAIAMLGAVSCKKEYTCTCTYDDGTGTSLTSTSTFEAKKKDAETICDDLQTLGALGTTGYTCTLSN